VIGDLHHALAAGAMTRSDVHAELGEIVAELKLARAREEERLHPDQPRSAAARRVLHAQPCSRLSHRWTDAVTSEEAGASH
jgi:hypothetical protein